MNSIRQAGATWGSAVALAVAATGTSLRAQAPVAARETVQLAFGYECEDRFLVRNDGLQTVTVQYGVQGNPERSSLTLAAKQSVEISSVSENPVELWVAGKLAATERKGSRPCAPPAAAAPNEPDVVVRPLDPPSQYGAYPQYPPSEPNYPAPVVVVAPRPYYDYYDSYGSYYAPYYTPYRTSVSVVLPFVRFGWGSRVHTSRYVPFRPAPRGRVVGVARPRGRR